MRRLLVLCLMVAAAAIVWTSSASAATNAYCVGGHTEFYDSSSFEAFILDTFVVPAGGYWLFEVPGPPDDEDETFGEQLSDFDDLVLIGSFGFPGSVFVPVHAGACSGALPAPKNHSPLCYTKFSDDVVFVTNDELRELLGKGYWTPAVMAGNVSGNPQVQNIGSYHFVCNPVAAAKPTGTKVGGDGKTVVPDSFAADNPWWFEILA